MNREARKERDFSSEQKGEGGGNSNCRWGGFLIVADHPDVTIARCDSSRTADG